MIDAMLRLYFATYGAPMAFAAGIVSAAQPERQRYLACERRAASIERDEEIERLERRLTELRRR